LSTASRAEKRGTYSRPWLPANAAAWLIGRTVAVAVLVAIVACEEPPARAMDVGQWIWSSEDSARFVEASRTVPRLAPTVWIGTIRASPSGALQAGLGLSPTVAARSRVGVIIRFDDSFSNVWPAQTDSAIANAVGSSIRAMLDAAARTGVTITEVQLDYDCPERLLRRWSVVVAALARDALAGRTVWLTSLVVHIRHGDYGELFRDHVAGHILQVFDTGDRMSPSFAGQLQRLASQQRMPFRLGVGAFERRFPNGRSTNHRGWFAATPVMARSRWYRGVWVFPAGASWAPLLEPGQ
jgi:hypothetical protein